MNGSTEEMLVRALKLGGSLILVTGVARMAVDSTIAQAIVESAESAEPYVETPIGVLNTDGEPITIVVIPVRENTSLVINPNDWLADSSFGFIEEGDSDDETYH